MKNYSILFFILSFCTLHAQQANVSFLDLEKQTNDNGTLVYFFKGEIFSGTTVDSAEHEQKILKYIIENGLIQKQLGWDFDGNLVRSFDYKKGVLHGKVLLFFGNGQKYLEEHYNNGLIDGKQYGWYHDGSRRFIAEYFGGIELSRYEYPKPGSKDWKSVPDEQ